MCCAMTTLVSSQVANLTGAGQSSPKVLRHERMLISRLTLNVGPESGAPIIPHWLKQSIGYAYDSCLVLTHIRLYDPDAPQMSVKSITPKLYYRSGLHI